MTKTEAIATIQSHLPALTAEQANALAELTKAWTRTSGDETETTRAAIAEAIAEADRGEFVDPAKVDELLRKPWA